MAHDAAAAPRHPGVRFPPPVLFVAGLLLGWLHQRVRPVGVVADSAHAAAEVSGTLLLTLGLGLMGWGLVTFLRARTAIIPHYPASQLVARGPYRFTRNPMYLGMTLVYLGLVLVLNWLWPLLLLPLVLALLTVLVIRREERYLASAFGDDYEAYRRRVRRWI